MEYVNHVITEGSVTVIFNNNGNNEAQTVRSDNGLFGKIIEKLRAKDFSGIDVLCSKAAYVNGRTDGRFEVKSGRVYVDGEPLPSSLSKILINLIDAECDINPLLKFWDNLKENPSARSRECLYTFLEVNSCTITQDGMFIGYKAVRNDYMDKYSGTINNSVGEEPEMPRNKVNDDPQHTCSFGLHVAAFDYAANRYGKKQDGDRLLAVKVNPADVVAVPYDYNNTKIRACKYKVVEDITDEWKEKTEPLYLEDEDVCDDCEFCGCYEEECSCDANYVDEEDEENNFSTYQAIVTSEGRLEIPQQAIKDFGIKSIKHGHVMEFSYDTVTDNYHPDARNIDTNGRIVLPKSIILNKLGYLPNKEVEIEVYDDGLMYL